MERVLRFLGVLALGGGGRTLEQWNAAVAEVFCQSGMVHMDLACAPHEMPVATAGRFYHRLFGEGQAASLHMAISAASASRMPGGATIASFHRVLTTLTYASGRRVLETGDLRVIFDHAFRIRVWAFASDGAEGFQARRRPAAPDDALTRIPEVSIARNVGWPNGAHHPVPRRRKSALGRPATDESALPPCAVQHLEIAHTVGLMQDLMRIQIQNPGPGSDPLALWRASVNPEPLARAAATSERRRPRRRSNAGVPVAAQTAAAAAEKGPAPALPNPATKAAAAAALAS